MKVRKIAILTLLVISLSAPAAFAGVIDFEDGWDGGAISSNIRGLTFTHTSGFDWIYGDWRTNDYNGSYPNYDVTFQYPIESQYYSDGNIFAWLGIEQGTGVISFTETYATYFSIGFSSANVFYLEAYDVYGNLLDSDIGFDNLGTGIMNYLRVDAPGMAYVMLHDTGNYWLVDNLDTDAITQCSMDIHCDDGVACNGTEACNQHVCEPGEPLECDDDGLFCNGDELCSEDESGCASTGDPCVDQEGDCDEERDECLTEEELADEELWPTGKVSGGTSSECCG